MAAFIAPTRGSNCVMVVVDSVPWGLHRPYEGQQPGWILAIGAAGLAFIAPTRGSNATLKANSRS
ncbi:hypothetical protein [Nocardiopsis alba]|uniref:hypothetical protein n=1 Tax=Nocardiopsis alba TaxID=53437 RepID=UPI003F4D6588